MSRFTNEQLEQARYANLYQFLIDNYEDDYTIQGGELRMKDNHSVTIMRDSGIFTDWGNGKRGNGITFLMDYYGYSFQDAVKALIDGYAADDHEAVVTQKKHTKERKEREIEIPEKYDGEPRHLYAYLMSRAISQETIKALLNAGLIFQDTHRNIVFLNYGKTCFEIRGTFTFVDQPFRQLSPNSADKFWYFIIGDDPKIVYITEAAIDAISLFELRNHEPAIYASMHGVGNQQIIDSIKAVGKYEVILAVDNDKAGFECQLRNPDLKAITPINKDWNEDLQKMRKESG